MKIIPKKHKTGKPKFQVLSGRFSSAVVISAADKPALNRLIRLIEKVAKKHAGAVVPMSAAIEQDALPLNPREVQDASLVNSPVVKPPLPSNLTVPKVTKKAQRAPCERPISFDPVKSSGAVVLGPVPSDWVVPSSPVWSSLVV